MLLKNTVSKSIFYRPANLAKKETSAQSFSYEFSEYTFSQFRFHEFLFGEILRNTVGKLFLTSHFAIEEGAIFLKNFFMMFFMMF